MVETTSLNSLRANEFINLKHYTCIFGFLQRIPRIISLTIFPLVLPFLFSIHVIEPHPLQCVEVHTYICIYDILMSIPIKITAFCRDAVQSDGYLPMFRR
jgi:hypothetical protein